MNLLIEIIITFFFEGIIDLTRNKEISFGYRLSALIVATILYLIFVGAFSFLIFSVIDNIFVDIFFMLLILIFIYCLIKLWIDVFKNINK